MIGSNRALALSCMALAFGLGVGYVVGVTHTADSARKIVARMPVTLGPENGYQAREVWYFPPTVENGGVAPAEKSQDTLPPGVPGVQISSRLLDLSKSIDGWVKAGGIKPDGGSAPIRVDDDGRVICAPQR